MGRITFHPVKTEEDIRILAAVANEIWHQHFTPIIGAAQVEYMVDKFQSEHAITGQLANGYRYYQFYVDGQAVGFTGIHPETEEKKLFLSKLYLKKANRKQGLAREAFSFLLEICEKEGLDVIWLTVNRENYDTIEVYKHLGFQVVREQKADIGCGFYMDDYIMEYQVNEHDK